MRVCASVCVFHASLCICESEGDRETACAEAKTMSKTIQNKPSDRWKKREKRKINRNSDFLLIWRPFLLHFQRIQHIRRTQHSVWFHLENEDYRNLLCAFFSPLLFYFIMWYLFFLFCSVRLSSQKMITFQICVCICICSEVRTKDIRQDWDGIEWPWIKCTADEELKMRQSGKWEKRGRKRKTDGRWREWEIKGETSKCCA